MGPAIFFLHGLEYDYTKNVVKCCEAPKETRIIVHAVVQYNYCTANSAFLPKSINLLGLSFQLSSLNLPSGGGGGLVAWILWYSSLNGWLMSPPPPPHPPTRVQIGSRLPKTPQPVVCKVLLHVQSSPPLSADLTGELNGGTGQQAAQSGDQQNQKLTLDPANLALRNIWAYGHWTDTHTHPHTRTHTRAQMN